MGTQSLFQLKRATSKNIYLYIQRDNPKIKTKTLEKNIKNKSYAI